MHYIQTVKCSFDGSIHKDTKEATRHLDKVYGDKIRSITTSLSILNLAKNRTVAISDFIDDNLHLFIELQKIKNDLIVVKDDDLYED